jgi:peptide-methionine (S)-S-oxide reductase
VGYAGGKKANPTYHDLGDHTESFEVDFDPRKISYERLLEIFWAGHDPTSRPWSTQYKAAIFVRDDAQRAVAERSRDALAAKGTTVRTEILPLGTFTLAEDYHQKYYLKRLVKPVAELRALFPSERAFTDSTAVMRANALAGGEVEKAVLERDLERLGLSRAAREELAGRAGPLCR